MRFLIFVVLMLGVTGIACAQMTDAQVIEAVKSAQAQGKSQDEIILMLSQKGVTKEQVLRIKASLESQGSNTTGTQTMGDSRMRVNNTFGNVRDSLSLNLKRNRNNVYGRELFNNKMLTFEPSLNIPTPENYKLGPGDEVIIDIWGNSEETIRATISPEGSITIPNLGPVYLSGKLINEASSYMKNMLARIYSDLNSENPGTFLKVSLGSEVFR